MKIRNLAFLIFVLVCMQIEAQESHSTAMQSKTEIRDTTSLDIPVNGFIRDVNFVDYYLKQEKEFFAPALAGGISAGYKSSSIELGIFIEKSNYSGYFLSVGSAIDIKELDANWVRVIACLGEITYVNDQSTSAESWIYTAGLGTALVRPFQWGKLTLAFMVAGAYYNNETILQARTMIDLSIPIF